MTFHFYSFFSELAVVTWICDFFLMLLFFDSLVFYRIFCMLRWRLFLLLFVTAAAAFLFSVFRFSDGVWFLSLFDTRDSVFLFEKKNVAFSLNWYFTAFLEED